MRPIITIRCTIPPCTFTSNRRFLWSNRVPVSFARVCLGFITFTFYRATRFPSDTWWNKVLYFIVRALQTCAMSRRFSLEFVRSIKCNIITLGHFFVFLQDAITSSAQTLLRCLNHGAFNEILGLVSRLISFLFPDNIYLCVCVLYAS